MRTMSLASIVAAFVVMAVCAKPERQPPKEMPKNPEPLLLKICGQTNWGFLTQAGRQLAWHGDPVWDGLGEIRMDGKINIIWTLRATGEPCPGVYDAPREDGALSGSGVTAARVSTSTPRGNCRRAILAA